MKIAGPWKKKYYRASEKYIYTRALLHHNEVSEFLEAQIVENVLNDRWSWRYISGNAGSLYDQASRSGLCYSIEAAKRYVDSALQNDGWTLIDDERLLNLL